jgi:hypothetical protein
MRAENLYLRALRLARETGQSDDEAHALEGSGECYLHRDETKAGVAHLKQALEIFQRLAMQPDADRIQARLASIASPQASQVVAEPLTAVPQAGPAATPYGPHVACLESD